MSTNFEERALTIRSRAPTRIDLAGGTLDIWPLYLWLSPALTVNIAINLYAEAEVREHSSSGIGKIKLISSDQEREQEYAWEDLEKNRNISASLKLPYKMLQYFLQEKRKHPHWSWEAQKAKDITIRTQAKSPAGAGLGGSSSLGIALAGALHTWAFGPSADTRNTSQRLQLIQITRDIETQILGVPAGEQDYFGACFGGLQKLNWELGAERSEHLSDGLARALGERLFLFYSGKSRNSGLNNWKLFKGFVDHEGSIRELFARIAGSAEQLWEALKEEDWEKVGEAISKEWVSRRKLARGISTPAIDRALQKADQKASAAGKVCGAGGGGCFFVFVPQGESAQKTTLQNAIVHEEIRPLPFEVDTEGLQVQLGEGRA